MPCWTALKWITAVWGTVQDHKAYIDIQRDESRETVFELYFQMTRKARTDHQVSSATLFIHSLTYRHSRTLVTEPFLQILRAPDMFGGSGTYSMEPVGMLTDVRPNDFLIRS